MVGERCLPHGLCRTRLGLAQCAQQQSGQGGLLPPEATGLPTGQLERRHYVSRVVAGVAMRRRVLRICEVRILVPTQERQEGGQAHLVSGFPQRNPLQEGRKEGRNSNETLWH